MTILKRGVYVLSVSLYFGLPGSGKTTYATYVAVSQQKRIDKGRSPYNAVYTNYPVNYNGIRKLNTSDLGKYSITNALIIIDEATLMADSRDYKTFSYEMKSFFLLHRHFNVDLMLFTQQWDGVDKKIRVITDRCYYIHKGFIRRWISYCQRIPYGIIIPDKKSQGEKLGEIIQGYCKPPLLVRMFSPRINRRSVYKYFDSFDTPDLPDYTVSYWTAPAQNKSVLFKITKKLSSRSVDRAGSHTKLKSFFVNLYKNIQVRKHRK